MKKSSIWDMLHLGVPEGIQVVAAGASVPQQRVEHRTAPWPGDSERRKKPIARGGKARESHDLRGEQQTTKETGGEMVRKVRRTGRH